MVGIVIGLSAAVLLLAFLAFKAAMMAADARDAAFEARSMAEEMERRLSKLKLAEAKE